MEEVIVKRKHFNIEEELKNNFFKVSYKNKTYILKRFFDDIEAYNDFIFTVNHLVNAGIQCPRIYRADKKTHDVILTYFEGKTVYDILLEKELDEVVYDNLYRVNWMAKQSKLFLDFDPTKWLINGEDICYVGYKYSALDKTNEKYLIDHGIRLWNHTREFREFAINKGDFVGNIEFKKDYDMNKEILLMACKYYR